MKTCWRTILFVVPVLFVLIGLLSKTHAATTVSGSISGTWTRTGSPYLVAGNLLVTPGTTLTIGPGVRVNFQGPYVFEVDGVLQATGTPDEPIVFAQASAHIGWNGIFFNGSDGSGSNSFLTFCQIFGSENGGIRIIDATPAISNCVIANNSTAAGGGGIYARVKTGKLVLTSCVITNNTSSYQPGGGVNLNGPAEISNCIVSGNQAINSGSGGAFYLEGRAGQNGEVAFKNCEISGNTASYVGGGFYSSFVPARLINCKVNANVSSSHGAGFYAEGNGASAVFVNCTFASNNLPAIYMGSSQSAFVTNSILYFNNAGGAQFVFDVKYAYSNVQGGILGLPRKIGHRIVSFLEIGFC